MARIDFKGKTFVQNYHMQVKYHELIPDKSKSLTDKVSLHDNLILHGDNLKALKALLPMYAGKVKCIYIDPPYNTGSENWVYNDNVNSPMMQEWLGKVVDKDDLTRHDKWLCMMMPRLRLLWDMLHPEDGVLFISIDDNELHHLMTLMSSGMFGEENCRNILVVRRGIKNVQAQFKTVDRLAYGAEYVLMYSRNPDYKFKQFFIELEETRNGDWNNHWRGTDRPTMRYELFGITPETGQWRWAEKRSLAAIENYEQLLEDCDKSENEISEEEIESWYLNNDIGSGKLDLLRLSKKGKPEHFVPPTGTKLGSSLLADLKPNGGSQLKRLFGYKVFENPKSVDLIKRLIQIAGVSGGDIVLDSFAGSGTTAQAVLELNAEDGEDRRFILTQMPENIDKKLIAYKKGFRNVVDITAERTRRVIQGVSKSKNKKTQKGCGGSFSYFELGKAIKMEEILSGKTMPSYEDLARYVFYTATGEEYDPKAVKPDKHFIGESKDYLVYLFYKPDLEYLKQTALTMERAKKLGAYKKKRRLVFAPTKYLDQDHLDALRIVFAQLPFEIYKLAK